MTTGIHLSVKYNMNDRANGHCSFPSYSLSCTFTKRDEDDV